MRGKNECKTKCLAHVHIVKVAWQQELYTSRCLHFQVFLTLSHLVLSSPRFSTLCMLADNNPLKTPSTAGLQVHQHQKLTTSRQGSWLPSTSPILCEGNGQKGKYTYKMGQQVENKYSNIISFDSNVIC